MIVSESRIRLGWHRPLYFALVSLTTFAAMTLLHAALQDGGINLLEILLLLLYAILMLWISASFWTAALGFIRLIFERNQIIAHNNSEILNFKEKIGKTALVMPVYNEDPERIFAGLRAIEHALRELNAQQHFEIFILSDTRDPDTWIQEELLWRQWALELGTPARLFYRNRPLNTARKSGNLADFCRTWGGRYRYMIVLDADSLMSGESLIEMVRRMEADPKLALLQVPPVPVGHSSLFARMLQFAGSLYGRMFTAGLAFWQLDQSNFWGHNAIIRVAPFAAHCGLPKLPGREPFGGEILSHDFVEAALLARAGWKVQLAFDLGGSYEEIPPTLIDYAKRDRRWCQGNLQHARLIFAHGFQTISRIHFAMGVMSYLASPLWLLFLIVTGISAYLHSLERPVYFFGHNLFPVWPASYVIELSTVFWVTLIMLFLPKLLALILLTIKSDIRTGFGGLIRATVSVLVESLFSVLLAPVLMLFQSKFVGAILMRRNVGWPPQQRGDHQTGFAEALSAHGIQTIIAIILGTLSYFYIADFFWWFTPVLAGLILSIPVSLLTSRIAFGRFTKRIGIFLTPEEIKQPRVLELLREYLATKVLLPCKVEQQDALWWRALVDPCVHALHTSLLPEEAANRRRRHALEGLLFQLQDEGAASLCETEKRALIAHRDDLRVLHTLLWAAPQVPSLKTQCESD